jgi:hypothetical protein
MSYLYFQKNENKYQIGENAKKYFPELTNNNKWQLVFIF